MIWSCAILCSLLASWSAISSFLTTGQSWRARHFVELPLDRPGGQFYRKEVIKRKQSNQVQSGFIQYLGSPWLQSTVWLHSYSAQIQFTGLYISSVRQSTHSYCNIHTTFICIHSQHLLIHFLAYCLNNFIYGHNLDKNSHPEPSGTKYIETFGILPE